ncbi:YbjQ family protein [Euzebya rosea]|uniref:YbjQ family protein n=1 Tax=Euzebya rosea TaxID=2052804 RepID=UPI00196A2649|nr:heavy metal-binding domain-containing protein [Euzebya rosea]
MEAFFIPLLQLGVPIALLVIGGLVGQQRERAHLADLTEREQRTAHVPVTDLSRPPVGTTVQSGAMFVTGSVVIATDYYKRLAASLRSLVGGEVRALSPVLDRGRREARLRMVEEAIAAGASMVVNVRFETSTITLGASEVICYGTAIRTS